MTAASILDHLGQLVAFDTQNPPREIAPDHPIFDYIVGALGDGFAITRRDYGEGRIGLLAMRGTPELLFNVHLDTVPAGEGWSVDPLNLTIRGDWAFGRGVTDIKGAAAILLHLAQTSDAPLAILFSTDEEGRDPCVIANFCDEGLADPFDQVIVAEPTESRAVLAHRGFLSGTAYFRGTSGHTAQVAAVSSAVHDAALWAAKAVTAATDEDGELWDTRFNIGRIEGGIKTNMVAETAMARWSLRPTPGHESPMLRDRLFGMAPEAARVTWEVTGDFPCLPSENRLAVASETFAKNKGLEIGEPVDFWSEAALFSSHAMPAIVLGPGDIADAHTTDERLAVRQLDACLDQYRRALGIVS